MQLSIVIPCYNEGEVITKSCVELVESLNAFEGIIDRYEILLIVEKSSDDTLQKAKTLETTLNTVRVLENDCKYGKGYSVKRGILESKGRYILSVDADIPVNLDRYLKYMLMLIEEENTAAVYASAIWDKLDYKKRNAFRAFMTFSLLILRRFVLHQEVSDSQFGCKLYKADYVKPIANQLKIHNYLYDICLTDMILENGYQIEECIVKVEQFGEKSNVNIVSLLSCTRTFMRYALWDRKKYLEEQVKEVG